MVYPSSRKKVIAESQLVSLKRNKCCLLGDNKNRTTSHNTLIHKKIIKNYF